MNASLEQSILARLHLLDDSRLHEILAFIDKLAVERSQSPKMMGLFSHLNIDPVQLNQALSDVKFERLQSQKRLEDQI